MIANMEQIEYKSKEQRDLGFKDLILNGNDLEKKAIKFSKVEPIMKNDEIVRNSKGRPEWRDIWCIAYPRS
jgi:hypothetical protein